jgi:hypothetical protein
MTLIDDDVDEGVLQERDEQMDIEEQQQQTRFDISELKKTIQVASEGALTAKTVSTYRRYMHCPL